MKKKDIEGFNKKLIKEINNESILQDIFGLTMGRGENFWHMDRNDMREILESVLGKKL